MSGYKRIIFSFTIGALLLLGLFLLLGEAPRMARAASSELFVTTGGGGGCSQGDPCDLQTALSTATDGDTIYVAGGTYTGTGGVVITVTKSVTLYGGWDGEPTGPVVRDPETYVTILDGQNARRVVYVSGNISPTIDGFTITGGDASVAPISDGYGGGIYLRYVDGTATITGNRIISNVADANGWGHGGGVCLYKAPAAQVVNNVVLSNTASITGGRGYGGGIYLLDTVDGTTVITANRVISNVANANGRGYGGGIYLSDAPAVQVMNNVVLSNTASITDGLGHGGGIAFSGSDGLLMTGNQIEHNVAQGGPAADWGSDGGGVYCYLSNGATIHNNAIRHNIASIPANGNGGGVGLHCCDRTTIIGNVLQNNVGSASTTVGGGRGGGLFAYGSRDLTVGANRIVSNTAGLSDHFSWGGGLYLLRNTTFTMTNNIVAANSANREGGGMAFETDVTEPVTGTLAHNTFAANDRGSGEGRIAIHVNEPYVTLALTNNLIYSHTYGVYAVTTSTVRLDHTLFYAHSISDTGGPGAIVNTNPITGQDPRLTADYHLQFGSPAIDAGAILPWVTTDIDGDTRPNGDGYDIGADEFYGWCIYLPLVLR